MVTRACRARGDYAFRELGLDRIQSHRSVGSRRGRAIPEPLGFVQERVRRQAAWLNGHFEDLVVYVILARQWLRLR